MTFSNLQNPTKQPTSDLQRHPQSLRNGNEEFTYKDYYKWMNEQLSMRMPSLAMALLGNPTYKRPTEWRYGNKKHLVVHVAGQWQGRFHDFETGESGDALKLVQALTGYTGKALSDWVKNFIGYQPKTFVKQEKEAWKPIIPVPEEALKGDILEGLSEGFKQKGMFERGRYCYRDLEGNVFGYVVRFENGEDKITLPLSYCINDRDVKGWWWKGFPVPRFPYGAELLKGSLNTILIVEGEKKCDAARSIFPDMTVVSWVAGTGSVHLTEWSVLKGRDVILWPDNDGPGLKCMEKLKTILEKAGANSVRVVSLPAGTPQGWDLADSLPNGWDMATLDRLVREAV
jgi:hypothetical protein